MRILLLCFIVFVCVSSCFLISHVILSTASKLTQRHGATMSIKIYQVKCMLKESFSSSNQSCSRQSRFYKISFLFIHYCVKQGNLYEYTGNSLHLLNKVFISMHDSKVGQ